METKLKDNIYCEGFDDIKQWNEKGYCLKYQPFVNEYLLKCCLINELTETRAQQYVKRGVGGYYVPDFPETQSPSVFKTANQALTNVLRKKDGTFYEYVLIYEK